MAIYFVQPGRQPVVKIGSCVDEPAVRLRELQRYHHEPLKVLATIEGDVKAEFKLHKRFAKHRLHGEWFALDGELLAYIKTLSPAQGPVIPIEEEWRQVALIYGWRVKEKKRPGAKPRIDDAMKRRMQKKAALKGDKKMTLQEIADSEGIALSSIFGKFPGGRKAIIAWKPK